ncbi:MAG: DUF541 domain-containing protein [Methanophagales archaeon ANME-1-THS]|nr:MAG: DUF541 domain-containing protein [Methanophagales archaeon ANME-1-THS]
MKRIWILSVIAILALCASGISSFGRISVVSAVNSEDTTTISVSGTGIRETTPNQATVHLGVETQSAHVTDALEENSIKMQSVINAMEKLGVPKEEIETSYFSIYPIRDYEKRGEEIIGYQVTNEIIIELRDLDIIGDVIDTAIASGANRVTGVEFELSEAEEQKLRQEALKAACDDARRKADAIASGLGLTIVGVSTVRESSVYIYPYRAGGFDDYAMISAIPISIPPPIEPRDVHVSATIEVVYRCQ